MPTPRVLMSKIRQALQLLAAAAAPQWPAVVDWDRCCSACNQPTAFPGAPRLNARVPAPFDRLGG